MKRIIFTLLVSFILIFTVGCSKEYQLNSNMLPVTTNSETAAKYYFESWDKFHYEATDGLFENMDKAIEEDSSFFMAYASKASWYLFLGNTEEFENNANLAFNCDISLNDAEEIWKEFLQAKLNDPKADVTLLFQRMIDLYPNVPDAYIYAGFYSGKDEDQEKVISYFKKAVELSVDYPTAYLNYAYKLLGMERYEEAEPIFDKYSEMLPDAPNVYDSKGDYYMAIGDYQAAYENFMKANELGWSDKKALEAMAKITEAETEETEAETEE